MVTSGPTTKSKASALVFFATAFGLAGCVLLLPDEQFGAHCSIAGRDRPCGACVSRRCSRELDACCRGSDCGGLVDAVERCAQKSDTSCATLTAAADGPSGARKGLASCIATSCSSVCQPLVGSSQTSCHEEALSEGRACTCVMQEPTNDVACGSSIQPGTRCCAPTGWPGAALECTCAAVACSPTPEGCACVLTTNLAFNAPTRCEGAHCCASDDLCVCRPRPCDPFERTVETCSLDAVSCGPGRKELSTCSLRSAPP